VNNVLRNILVFCWNFTPKQFRIDFKSCVSLKFLLQDTKSPIAVVVICASNENIFQKAT